MLSVRDIGFMIHRSIQVGGLKMPDRDGALFESLGREDFFRPQATCGALNHIAGATVWPLFAAAV
ncbi:MAG TPA: hypothetical protein VKA60_06325 [Blastocatellia bacterium]|nr:hypothetical protein [Blastocatellia bacterium]